MNVTIELAQREIDSTIDKTIQSLQKIQLQLREGFQNLAEEKNNLEIRKKQLEAKEKSFHEQKAQWDKEKEVAADLNAKMVDIIKLNVGGTVFETTRETLCSMRGTMLEAMFSGRHTLKKDGNDMHVIDRDPELFRHILGFLRDKTLRLPKDKIVAQNIIKELDYFCLPIQQIHVDFVLEQYVNKRNLVGHTNPVGCLGLLDNGKKLVSGSNDNTIKIWNLSTGTCEKTLTGHSGSVYSLKVYKDFIISGSHDKKIKIWDTQSDTCIATLAAHSDRVWCLQLSQDGKTIVSGGADNVIKVWDFASGQCLQSLKGHRSWVRCVEIKDGFIYSGSDDNEIRIWSLETGKCIKVIKGHDESVFALALSNDIIVSGAKDQTIRIWDRHSGDLKKTLFGHTRPVYCLQVIDNLIISGSWDGTIKIWDLNTSECLQTLRGHNKAVYTVIMNDTMLISGSSDNMLKIWAPSNGGGMELYGQMPVIGAGDTGTGKGGEEDCG